MVSRGEYGVPEGLVFSLPARCVEGEWQVEAGLALTETLQVGVVWCGQRMFCLLQAHHYWHMYCLWHCVVDVVVTAMWLARPQPPPPPF